MIVLFDLGNTACKWGLAQDGLLLRSGTLPRDAEFHWSLEALAMSLPRPGSAYGISVTNPDGWAVLERVCMKCWRLSPVPIDTPAIGGGVRVAYDCPASLGTDRWAAMVGVLARGWAPAVVVDCGTAATLDVVDAAGNHHGGLIWPGLEVMRRSLHTETHGLPSVESGSSPMLATNTPDAMRAGTLRGLCQMVDGFYETLSKECGEPLRPVLTGGDAGTLHAQLRHSFHVAPDLVLEGMAHYVESRGCESL